MLPASSSAPVFRLSGRVMRSLRGGVILFLLSLGLFFHGLLFLWLLFLFREQFDGKLQEIHE